MTGYRLGIDVGGTFTDFVLLRDGDWRVWTHKQLTTPDEPTRGIMAGLATLLRRAGLTVDEVAEAHIVHGTTLVTNALIERRGARVALITTRGARDVLETGKENRYDPYDRYIRRPSPLVERRFRREIDERVAHDGTVRRSLNATQVEQLLDELRAEGIEALAVCLLHAYRNPVHEQAIGRLAAARGFVVSLSSEVAPQLGEYERVSTTVANAYVQPFTARYLAELDRALKEAGFRRGFFLMLSDGGIAAPDAVLRAPIRILESGPAAGALAAAFCGRVLGLPDLIAFDMGGTTAKICLIRDGVPARTAMFEVGRADRTMKGSGLPVRVPAVEMLEIGAGGGSVARLDDMGLLKVGPHSAGADPGPACYGLGGTAPTVTDANLLLGYLSDGAALGEDLRLNGRLATAAVTPIAGALGVGLEVAADGIRQVVTEAMAHAVKLHVTESGRDPRDYVLFAFGGAGPLHACGIAQRLGIGRVIIPAGAGVLSAFGFIAAPPAVELTHTFLADLDTLLRDRLERLATELAARAMDMLCAAGLTPRQMTLQYTLQMRYKGQGYDVAVTLPPGSVETDPVILRRRFEAAYVALYGRRLAEPRVEVREVRLWAAGPAPDVRLPEANSRPGPRRTRRAVFPGAGEVDCPVFDRAALARDTVLAGPCLIEDPHTTTVLPPGTTCRIDRYGNLMVDVPARAAWRPGSGRALTAIDLEILLARLRSIMDECDRTILRTAFSAAVRDGKDYAVGMSDPVGNLLALPTETMPLFVTCMPRSISLMIQHFPPEMLEPGDVLVSNDPWIVAGHTHDLFVLKPVFYRHRLVAFVGAVSHLPDIGGAVGDFRAWDLYEEGLIIPPMKLYEAGRPNEILLTLLRANVRLPAEVLGDLGALLAALKVGEERLLKFLADSGLEEFTVVSKEIGRRAVAAFREAATRIPRGTYAYTFTADGVGGPMAAEEPIQIRATLTADSEGLAVDYEGTSPQVPHFPINVPIPYTLADTTYALQYLLNPGLPNVGPSYTLVRVQAPQGCILNATPPAPVYARTRTGVHITTALCGALVQAAPDLVMAGCGHNVILKVAGTRPDGSYYAVGLMPKGGMGATADQDGWNVTVYPTNCTMVPTEVLETLAPVEMDREMLTDSGGPGRRRGGLGQRVTLRSRSLHPVMVSIRSNFVRHPPPGFLAGLPGGPVRALLNGRLIPENPVILRAGDELVIETAGGGGFGNPLEREPERVLEDVLQGYVSVAAARDVYGVAVDPATGFLDEEATNLLRQRRMVAAP
ncbi:MAG: hydantoinase B/oxoprolinase family protein [Armatimonadota bacterium]|nr:hydantoinase B/oxoprolinase family protein [Armatimonadota bacterium]